MTTYHHQVFLQTLPFIEDNKVNNGLTSDYNVSPVGSCTASSTNSDSSGSDGELLQDLWQTTSPNANQKHESPRMMQPSNMWNATVESPSYISNTFERRTNQDISVPMASQVPRDPSMEYAKFLLPNNLLDSGLPALTEENLFSFSAGAKYKSNSRSSLFSEPSSDDLFNFEQQQHQQQQHQQPHIHAHLPSPQSYKSNNNQSKTTNVNTQLYKTELCASFIKTGVCPYGNKCQFAHGNCELKSIERSPKWRSKPCANWSKFGSCRYGNRCCFKHGE